MKRRKRKIGAAAAGLVGCAIFMFPLIAAAQVSVAENFLTPDFRGDPETAFDGWAGFFGGEAVTPAGGPGGNAPNWPSSDGSAFLRQTRSDVGALITGGGSLYSFRGPLELEIEQTTDFDVGMVALQVRTSGSLPDYDSVYLRYQDEENEVFLAPTPVAGLGRIDLLDRQEDFMDDTSKIRESLWQWDLSGIDGITNYSVLFAGEKAHLNLQAVTVDAASVYSPIPEPSTVGLMMGIFIGGGAFWIRRRKKISDKKEIGP